MNVSIIYIYSIKFPQSEQNVTSYVKYPLQIM